MAGSMESLELANSMALHLPASRIEGRWEDLGPPPGAVLRLPAFITVFFLDDSAILSSLRSAGVTCKVDIALIKANSSCLNIAAAGALLPLSSLSYAAVSVSWQTLSFLCRLSTASNPTI